MRITKILLLLSKGLSGGFYPVSAVFANDEIMSGLLRGQHGSTFGTIDPSTPPPPQRTSFFWLLDR